MEEGVISGDSQEEAVDRPDGAGGTRLDVLQNERRERAVRVSREKKGWREHVGVGPPKLGDPGLVAGFDKGDGETEWSRGKGTGKGRERGVSRKSFGKKVNTVAKRVTTMARDPVEKKLATHGLNCTNQAVDEED